MQVAALWVSPALTRPAVKSASLGRALATGVPLDGFPDADAPTLAGRKPSTTHAGLATAFDRETGPEVTS